MKRVYRHGLALGLMASCFGLALSANADNRFSQDGGMVGGVGSFAEGEITVYHNFIDSDRQELNQRIQDLKNLINSLNSEIEAKEQQANVLQTNYDNTRAEMARMRSKYGL